LREEVVGGVVMIKTVLKAPGWDFKDELGGGYCVGRGEEFRVIGIGQGREVVTEDPDGPGWMSGRVPRREMLGIYGLELVNFG
jgi:hypothetical protein